MKDSGKSNSTSSSSSKPTSVRRIVSPKRLQKGSNVGKKDSTTLEFVYSASVSKNVASARFWHSASTSGKSMWVYGGHDGEKITNSLEIFDYSTSVWTTINPPSPLPDRYQHSSVYKDDRLHVFGGSTDFSSNATNSFFSITKEGIVEEIKSQGTLPPPRKGHVALKYKNVMYIFGGSSETETFNDMYMYDFSTNVWEKINQQGSIPCPRIYHSSCLVLDKIYVYGGRDNSGQDLKDFYMFDITNSTWKQIAMKGKILPQEKHGHTLVAFKLVDSEVLLFGGDEKATAFEVYKYSLRDQGWSLISYEGDTGVPRKFHTAVDDGYKVYIFGGKGDKSSCLDTIEAQIVSSKDDDYISSINRQDWEATAMKRLPEILALRERLRALTGEQSYSANIAVSKTEDKTKLPAKLVIQLIMEFLSDQGFKRTLDALEKATGINYIIQTPHENGLRALLDFAERLTLGTPVFSSELKNFKWPWERDILDPEVSDIDHLPGYYTQNQVNTDSKVHDNIWEDDESNVKRKDGEIVAGNLNALVMYLIQRANKDVKRCFLWCHKNWATSELVFRKLVELYEVPQGIQRTDAKRIKKSTINTIKNWLEECPSDFQQPELAEAFHNFIDFNLSRDNKEQQIQELRSSFKKVQKILDRKNEPVFSYNKDNPPPEPSVPRNIFSPDLKLEDISELELARQLTLFSHHKFCLITQSEAASGAWETLTSEEKCPNIFKAINWFQSVTLWVSEEIKSAGSDSKERGKKFKRFSSLCEHLEPLNNYQVMASIIQGMASESKHKQPLPQGEIQVYDSSFARSDGAQLENINNKLIPLFFGKKRNEYERMIDILQRKDPCVPILSYLLKEITDVEEQDFLDGSTISFNKSMKIFPTLSKLKNLQSLRYNLLPVHQIQILFNRFPKAK